MAREFTWALSEIGVVHEVLKYGNSGFYFLILSILLMKKGTFEDYDNKKINKEMRKMLKKKATKQKEKFLKSRKGYMNKSTENTRNSMWETVVANLHDCTIAYHKFDFMMAKEEDANSD